MKPDKLQMSVMRSLLSLSSIIVHNCENVNNGKALCGKCVSFEGTNPSSLTVWSSILLVKSISRWKEDIRDIC